MPALGWATHHRFWAMGAGCAVVLILAVAAGVWFLILRSPGTQLDVRQALRLYRHDQGAPNAGRSPRLPPAGVYRYRTIGNETLSLGDIHRSFPSPTEMILTDGTCTTVRWEPFEQHVEGLVECPGGNGSTTMTSATSDEQIAGIRTTEVIRCPASTYFVPPDPSPGRRWETTCRTAEERVRLTGTVVGATSVAVGRKSVPALHTRITLNFQGAETGTNPTDYWVSAVNGLILRERETVDVSERAGPLGPVRYHESMAITLESVTPLR